MVEGLCDGAGVNRSTSIEREQRVIGLGFAGANFLVSQIVGESAPEARTVWNKPILGKFRLADLEQIAFEIDIFAAKPGNFPDSESQGVHQGKNEVIGLSPVGSLGAIRQ